MALEYYSLAGVCKVNEDTIAQSSENRADQYELVKPSRIVAVLNATEHTPGDVYDKAVILLMGLVSAHAFASANKRTGFLVTKGFILANGLTFNIIDEKDRNTATLIGIREGYYTKEDLKKWLQTGKIHERTRK